MLLLSFGVHLLVVFLLAGALAPHVRRELRPVYYVDLVNPPVADPRAGRPDARPEAPKPEPRRPEPKPEPPKAPPKPTVKPEPAKPVAKEALKSPARPATKAADDKALQEKLRQMQARRDEEEYSATLKKLAARDTRQAAPEVKAPVGEQTGKGTEIGVAHATWLHAHLKEEWSYSPYLSSRLDLEAVYILYFDERGSLLNYKPKHPSGNEQFDQSIVRAILKLFKERTLPNPPKQRTEIEVVFNLKELKK